MKVQAIALNTFREAVRNKILYSVVLFAIVLVLVSALFGAVTIGDQAKVIKDFGLFSLSFFGAIITIICGTTLLNKELKQKTIYNILSKPVERWQFIVGKHLGLTFTVSALVGLMGLALTAFLGLYEGRLDVLLVQGVMLTILEVAVVAAVCIFFSALVVTTTLSGLFTLATYIAGRSIAYFSFFQQGEHYEPTIAKVVTVFDYILPDLSLFNFSDSIVYGTPVPSEDFAFAAVYAAAYSVAALTLATLIFMKRELQ
ncbi:MAG: ABC transporter permease subunit [Bdellovibrionales bacterium]|nr:ABC transporter permease subunit [Bdellovibrionales bacterium]